MAEADDHEGFLARWSRRKRAARDGVEPPASEAPAAPGPAEPTRATLPEPEEPVDLSALPMLDDLTPASDITAFLRKGVPLSLRNAALRRIWSLDPAIRDYIGPVDYGWDWNTPGGVPDYVAEIGETPEIRQLVERMLASTPARNEPGSRPAEPAVARLQPAPEAVPALEPPTAGATVERATEPPGAAEATAEARPGRPRHGGALPV
ncbi:DUF3306 domain-containing protein [Elioraea sp.]|uniref:DUF3306 domain-containing protein n=1 Tax=Elioraea sp. TaxID=2185103 RepID=UPI003F6F9487